MQGYWSSAVHCWASNMYALGAHWTAGVKCAVICGCASRASPCSVRVIMVANTMRLYRRSCWCTLHTARWTEVAQYVPCPECSALRPFIISSVVSLCGASECTRLLCHTTRRVIAWMMLISSHSPSFEAASMPKRLIIPLCHRRACTPLALHA